MKLKHSITCCLLLLIFGCNSSEKSSSSNLEGFDVTEFSQAAEQIGEYVVATYQDSKDNLWFGTLEKGVAMYDGRQLQYYTVADGLPSNRVVDIIEMPSGEIWLSTGSGLSKFDGMNFKNFDESDGLCSNRLTGIMPDSKGMLWIGTWDGVCLYDGAVFSEFQLPTPSVTTRINPDTENWITNLTEDSQGNIWIARDGYGAYKYDGDSIIHFTKKDGLLSNNVTDIREDSEGNFWIGSRVGEKDHPNTSMRQGPGGLNKLEQGDFLTFPDIPGFMDDDIYEVFISSQDEIWVSSVTHGIYRLIQDAWQHFDFHASVMSITEDDSGRLWLGCAGGLYRMEGDSVLNVTVDGPW